MLQKNDGVIIWRSKKQSSKQASEPERPPSSAGIILIVLLFFLFSFGASGCFDKGTDDDSGAIGSSGKGKVLGYYDGSGIDWRLGADQVAVSSIRLIQIQADGTEHIVSRPETVGLETDHTFTLHTDVMERNLIVEVILTDGHVVRSLLPYAPSEEEVIYAEPLDVGSTVQVGVFKQWVEDGESPTEINTLYLKEYLNLGSIPTWLEQGSIAEQELIAMYADVMKQCRAVFEQALLDDAIQTLPIVTVPDLYDLKLEQRKAFTQQLYETPGSSLVYEQALSVYETQIWQAYQTASVDPISVANGKLITMEAVHRLLVNKLNAWSLSDAQFKALLGKISQVWLVWYRQLFITYAEEVILESYFQVGVEEYQTGVTYPEYTLDVFETYSTNLFGVLANLLVDPDLTIDSSLAGYRSTYNSDLQEMLKSVVGIVPGTLTLADSTQVQDFITTSVPYGTTLENSLLLAESSGDPVQEVFNAFETYYEACYAEGVTLFDIPPMLAISNPDVYVNRIVLIYALLFVLH